MKIKNGWKIQDGVSGLDIRSIEGKELDHLHNRKYYTEK